MLKAIIVYQFLLQSSSTGDISPIFMELAMEYPDEMREVLHNGSIIVDKGLLGQTGIITLNDLFGLFFNLSTGGKKVHTCEDMVIQTLKESPYKVIVHYFQRGEANKFLFVTFFDLNDMVEEFLTITSRMTPNLEKIISDTLKTQSDGIQFRQVVGDLIKGELKYFGINIGRFFSLSQIQKAASIFASPERFRVLELLRNGPVARKTLKLELEKINRNPNLDIILRPFLELNICRREWTKSSYDRKTKQKFEEGEYLFLINDIALTRKIPGDLLEKIRKDNRINKKYEKRLGDFFHRYNPFEDINAESKKLARFLLNFDAFDLLALLRTQYYPTDKFPNVMTDRSAFDKLLVELRENDIVYVVTDDEDRKWVCLLCDIAMINVFPEYLIRQITDQASIKRSKTAPKGAKIFTREIAPQVAHIALKMLQNAYYERSSSKEEKLW